MFLTMHASLMVFFVIIPLLVGGFGNYLIPLKIGAHDMAFPFLNGLSYWLGLAAGSIMIAGFFLVGNAASAGWTSYAPLSGIATNAGQLWPLAPKILVGAAFFLFYAYVAFYAMRPAWLGIIVAIACAMITLLGIEYLAIDGQACWFLSLFVLGFGSILGAINYLATIIRLRCPGMTMYHLPMSIWSLFITAMIVLLATPVLGADLLQNLLDHRGLTKFFEPVGGGYALLHIHLFWFYSHPAVYIMILPAMGMVSDILPTFARKPLFGYRAMVHATGAIAVLGFVVWGHHMFQTPMNPSLGTAFGVSTMVIAVPSGVKVFNWIGTIWGGNIRLSVPMLFALAFVSMFIIGGLSGIFMASTAVDVTIHMTYFIVAHIHYVLFGASMFGIFAAIYFWYPKMFGRMMSPSLGYWHFALSFIAFNCTFLPMHILGLQGMPRRVSDLTSYPSLMHLQPLNQFVSFSAFALGAAQIPFIVNFLGSWIWGKKAPDNPWEATTLEWETSSPPPPENFLKTPVVVRGPYEYANPLVKEDWISQTRVVESAPTS